MSPDLGQPVREDPWGNPGSSSHTDPSQGKSAIPPSQESLPAEVFWAGGAFVTNRLRSLFSEFLPCPAACLWHSGVVIVVLTPSQAPIHRAFPPCPSSKLLHMALSSLNIFHLGLHYNPNAVFFHYSLFCISWSVIKLKSHSPLNTLNNCL